MGDKTDWILDASINEKGELKLIHTTKDQASNLLASHFGVKFDKA